ncbi:hypothetical protein JCM19238_2763 [Vibrio ponticus]|nr:hypothetical protein JCM19238_2763 [Vibrio ponticus]
MKNPRKAQWLDHWHTGNEIYPMFFQKMLLVCGPDQINR